MSNLIKALINNSIDVSRANEIIDKADIKDYDVAKFMHEYAEMCKMPISKLDPVASVYEYILQEVRQEIEKLTGKDIINDMDEVIVAGNYICTNYDRCEVVSNFLKKNIKEGMETSQALKWFIEEISY